MNDVGDRQKPTGFTRMFRAFGVSMKGLAGAFREEAAFRQELALAVRGHPSGPVVRSQMASSAHC